MDAHGRPARSRRPAARAPAAPAVRSPGRALRNDRSRTRWRSGVLDPSRLLLAATWRAFGACPVIVQRRTGLNGRPFPLLKVRTLAGPDTSSENTLDWHHDPRRLAAFGAAVRRTGLDEILQIWNVAAGQMALIGPRPRLPQEQLAVERLLPEARRRLAVRPGLIGLAAVLNRRPSGLDGYLAHATADLEYVAAATPALDGRICWLALRVLMDGRDRTTVHVRSDAARS